MNTTSYKNLRRPFTVLASILVAASVLAQILVPVHAAGGAQSSPTPIVRDHRTPTRSNERVVVPRRTADSGQTASTIQTLLPQLSWPTLIAILTAVAGFIGAIAALVAAFRAKKS